jgi:hypothetical protein
MMQELIFWLGLALSVGIGLMYFRDLGDVSQMLIKVKRKNTIRFIRHEYRLIGAGLASAAVMVIAHLLFSAGPGWMFWTALALLAFLYGFPWIWVHLGLRNQKSDAEYYSIEEGRKFVSPATAYWSLKTTARPGPTRIMN